MGLFGLFGKKKEPVSQTNKTNSVGEDLTRLTPEGELPWGWISHYSDFVKAQENLIDDQWKNVYNAKGTDSEVDAYKAYFDVVNDVGETCKQTGECHYKWFCEYIIGSGWYEEQVKKYKKLKKA